MKEQELADAWRAFTDTIEAARQKIVGSQLFQERPWARAQAYRNLLEAQAMAYNMAVAPKTSLPRTFQQTGYQTDFYTIGLACQDFYHVVSFLDGKRRYRITGRLGDLVWIASQVQSRLIGVPGARNLGDINYRDFELGPDGSFEVIVSGTPEPGNHILIDPESDYNFIWTRRALLDWADDGGEFHIELIDKPDVPPVEEVDLVRRLEYASHFAKHLLESWAGGMYDMYMQLAGEVNKFAYLGGAVVEDTHVGSPKTIYGVFLFELKEDEAIIIEGDKPDCAYWGLQLGNVWSNSLDFVNRQTDLNPRRVVIDSDGKYRAVISLEDPGVANWLDPAGSPAGLGIIRIVNSIKRDELPKMTVVKRSELKAALPPDTRYLTREERAEVLRHREQSIRKLFKQ